MLINLKKDSLDSTHPFLAPLLIPRVSGTENNILVQEFLVKTFQKLGWTVERDDFSGETPLGPKKFCNIIATFDPSASRRLVLSAHFDSKFFESGTFIGATDSSGPVAILLQIASSLTPHLHRGSPIGLQMIFFDGEEAFKTWSDTDSRYGSRHLAKLYSEKAPVDPKFTIFSYTNYLEQIDLLVLLDLLGATKTNSGNFPSVFNYFQDTAKVFSHLCEIEKLLKSLDLLANPDFPYFVDQINENAGIQDDHTPFKDKSVPILHLIPREFPAVWHTLNDNEKALSNDVLDDLYKIILIFTAQYIDLSIGCDMS